MLGLKAERNLLGSVLMNAKQVRMLDGLVNRSDFSDDRMGIIWDTIVAMTSRGESVGLIEIVDKFPEIGVRGIDYLEVNSWMGEDVYQHGAQGYANHVRNESLRRSLDNIARTMHESVVDAGSSPADILTKARGLIDATLSDASTGVLQAKSLADVLDGDDTYDWVIPEFMESGDRLILTGGEGAGKSTFARQICILAAAGVHPLTFQSIDPVRVLVVDAENTERQWRRAVRWMVRRATESGSTDPRGNVMIAAGKRIDIIRGSHLAEIHRLIDEYEPRLLFIGPLYKITSGAIQTDDEAAPLLVALDSLRERGLAMVMEAHAAKGSSEHGREWRPRGSAALMGWPELGLGLSPINAEGVEVVRWRGDRDARAIPNFLRRGRDWPFEPADG